MPARPDECGHTTFGSPPSKLPLHDRQSIMSKSDISSLKEIRRYMTFETAALDSLSDPEIVRVKKKEMTAFVKERTRLYFQSAIWRLDEMIKRLEEKETNRLTRKKRRT